MGDSTPCLPQRGRARTAGGGRLNRRGKPLRYALLLLACTALSACQTLAPFGQHARLTLIDTYWKLIQVEGKAITVHGDAREPYLLLTDRDQQVEGFAGCNNIDGHYQRDRQQLHFEVRTDSGMFCAGTMALERAYIHALNHTTHARIVHHRLILLDAENRPLAKFRARLFH